MKRTFSLIATIILVFIVTFEVSAGSEYYFYKQLVNCEKIGTVREYWTDELSTEILTSRGDDIIIEKTIGTVINEKLDGRISGVDDQYNYISYKYVEGAQKGDVILTICIYPPGSDGEDDICQRFDYIIDRPEK